MGNHLVDPMIRIRVLESTVGSNAITIAQQTAMIEQLSLENHRLTEERDTPSDEHDKAETPTPSGDDGKVLA